MVRLQGLLVGLVNTFSAINVSSMDKLNAHSHSSAHY